MHANKPAAHTVVANGGHVPLGTTMHDNATLSGQVGSIAPTGAVTFLLDGVSPGANAATEGGFYATSANSGPLSSNNLALRTYTAAFAGDANYNAIASGTHPAEPFIVDKVTLTLTATLHADNPAATRLAADLGHVPLGTTMHDNATLTGQVDGITITGAVTFLLDGVSPGANAATEGGFYATSANSGPLSSNNLTPRSNKAAYAGDANYNAIASGTHPAETFIVDKGTLTLTTTMHADKPAAHTVVANGGHVPLGTTMHDNATLTGQVDGITITGAVTFLLDGVSPGANAATEGGFYATSANSGPLSSNNLALRTYTAAYAGDANYNALASGTHPARRSTVLKGTLTLTTTMHADKPAAHTVVANGGHVPLGTTMHDNATLTGQVDGITITGAVTCLVDGGSTGANAATEGGFYATSANSGPLSSNNLALRTYTAAFAGDANYNAIASGTHPAETFIVDKGTLTLTTTMHADKPAAHTVVANGGHVPLGTTMHDNATLSGQVGSIAPTGAVTFLLDGVSPGANAATEGSFYATSASSGPLTS